MRIAVVSELYPRATDPVLGIWAHRQALAARDAGADVRVLVLYRPVPPLRAARSGPVPLARATKRALAQPLHATLDGIEVTYVPFVSPPRPTSYGRWGRWAAPTLAVALRTLRRRFDFDLVHAHNAVPAGEAVRRARIDVPLVLSVHGSDVFHTARTPDGAGAVRAAFEHARLVLANSAGVERHARALGALATRVVRLGTDLPGQRARPYPERTVVTTGHVIARKRHRDVLDAVALLSARYPRLRYLVVGDGPEVASLRRRAAEHGIAARFELAGQLAPHEALTRTRRASLLAMPSTDEAFGLAYIEAMAGWVPAIGARGEPGPSEIASAGGGIWLVEPGDVRMLAERLDALLRDDRLLHAAGLAARATATSAFSWPRCGAATVAAYEDALGAP
jgi:glycosyltransferase involved in cell wall biosynthesis